MFDLGFLRLVKRKGIHKSSYALLKRLVEISTLVHNPLCEFHVQSEVK